jgi:hypothetical protein
MKDAYDLIQKYFINKYGEFLKDLEIYGVQLYGIFIFFLFIYLFIIIYKIYKIIYFKYTGFNMSWNNQDTAFIELGVWIISRYL